MEAKIMFKKHHSEGECFRIVEIIGGIRNFSRFLAISGCDNLELDDFFRYPRSLEIRDIYQQTTKIPINNFIVFCVWLQPTFFPLIRWFSGPRKSLEECHSKYRDSFAEDIHGGIVEWF